MRWDECMRRANETVGECGPNLTPLVSEVALSTRYRHDEVLAMLTDALTEEVARMYERDGE